MNTIQITEAQSTNYQVGTNVIQMSTNKNITEKPKIKKIKLRTKITEPVEPLKLKSDIELAKSYLMNKQGRYSDNQLRDYALFCVGINLSRRITDLLKRTVKDFLNPNGTFRNEFEMITGKKQKQECVIISQNTKDVLSLYFKANPELLEDRDNHLFPTRESNSMTRQTAFRIMKDVENEINKTKTDDNDKIHIATHSLRKTKAFWYIQNHKDDQYAILKVSHALGHNSQSTTMHYLGLDKKELLDYYSETI